MARDGAATGGDRGRALAVPQGHARAVVAGAMRAAESRAAAWSVLALAVVAHVWGTFRLAGDSFFYMDDFVGIQSTASYWSLVTHPYGGHVAYSTAALWYGLLEVVGTSSHLPYLGLSVVMSVAAALLVYRVGRRLTDRPIAVASALWLLFLAPAFHNQLWSQAALSQLTTMSLCVVVLARPPARRGVLITVAAALVGLGVGGLGLGLVVAAVVLLLLHRSWLAAGALTLLLAVVVVIGRVSLAQNGGVGGLGLGAVVRLPHYLTTAYFGTIEAGLGPAAPATGVVAVLLLVGVLAFLGRAVADPGKPWSQAIVVGLVYLLVTWSLTGLVRGLDDEVAAPRYVGVTGPALLVVGLGVCGAALERLAEAPTDLAWVRGRGARARLALGLILVVVATSALPAWIQHRRDASYLGTVNRGHLSALAAGAGWISPDFAPSGEGLTYVRAGTIGAAWRVHGQPALDPTMQAAGPYGSAFASGFLATLVEAGWVVADSGAHAGVGSCSTTLSVDTQSAQRIGYRLGAGDELTVSVLGAPGVSVVSGPAAGTLDVHPLAWGGPSQVSSAGGCLFLDGATAE